jgi:5-methylcytosine-specific restriction protein A
MISHGDWLQRTAETRLMPQTGGQGNPDWTREETILAMHLLVISDMRPPGKASAQVVALSELLNSLPFHPKELRNDKFRNPSGVAMKLQNILSCSKPGGLATSKTDRAVWAEFHDKPSELAALAESIRSAGELLTEAANADDWTDDGVMEGGLRMRAHLYRERVPSLRRMLIAQARKQGELFCEACGFKSMQRQRELVESQFECHHVIPLAEAGVRKTKVADLSLLCANCHRLVHAAMRSEQRGVSLADLRALVVHA